MKAFSICLVLTLVFAIFMRGGVLLMINSAGNVTHMGLLGTAIFAIGSLVTLLLAMSSLCMIFSPRLRREFMHGPHCNCQECEEERLTEVFLPAS